MAGRREAGVPGSSRGPQGSRGGGRSGGSLGRRGAAGRPTGFLARARPGHGRCGSSLRGRNARPVDEGRHSRVSFGSAERVRQQSRSRVGRNRETREKRPDFLGRGAPKGATWPPGEGQAPQPGAGLTPGGEQARTSRPGTIGGASAPRADPRRQAAVPPGRHASDLGPARLTPLFFGRNAAGSGPKTKAPAALIAPPALRLIPGEGSARTLRREGHAARSSPPDGGVDNTASPGAQPDFAAREERTTRFWGRPGAESRVRRSGGPARTWRRSPRPAPPCGAPNRRGGSRSACRRPPRRRDPHAARRRGR